MAAMIDWPNAKALPLLAEGQSSPPTPRQLRDGCETEKI